MTNSAVRAQPSSDHVLAAPVVQPKLSVSADLLRNWHPSDTVTLAVDGLVGCIFPCQPRFYITSPNDAGPIPDPQWGAERHVEMRKDGRYGRDDPIQWPQLFNEQLPHLSTIPLHPRHGRNDPYSEHIVMWEILTEEHLIQSPSTSLIPTAQLSPVISTRLTNAMNYIDEAIRKGFTDESELRHVDQVSGMKTLAHLCLARLVHAVTTPQELRRYFAEVQRHWLLLAGFIDYLTIFWPRIRKGSIYPRPDQVAHVMGAFTDSDFFAAQLFAGGIPCWLVRRADSFGGQKIKEVALTRDFMGVEEHASPPFPIIYTGGCGDREKVLAIIMDSLNSFRHATPFSAPFARPNHNHDVLAYPSASGPIRSERPPKRYTPLRERKPQCSLTKGDIDAIDASSRKLVGPYAPRILWKNVNIDIYSAQSQRRPKVPEDRYYWFPNPIIVLHSQDFRTRAALRTVKHLHLALIIRAREPGAKPLSSKQWRAITDLGVTPPDDEEKVEELVASTKFVKTHRAKEKSAAYEMVKSWLQRLVNPDDEKVRIQIHPPVTETKNVPVDLDEPTGQGYAWELVELNFRWELLSLDAHIVSCTITSASTFSGDDPTAVWALRRQALIFKVFATPLIDVRASYGCRGLASSSWRERVPYLEALWEVMQSWPGNHPPGWDFVKLERRRSGDPVLKFTAEELGRWEQTIANFYAQTFYDNFGRYPILPHAVSPEIR